MKHYDKPGHQRWLYQLSDMSWVKALTVIWGICWVTIIITWAALKFIFGHAK
jgi:hypothetical protein